MSENNVIRLIDKAPGYSPEDIHGLCDWLRYWADFFEQPGSWMPKSLAVVIETDDGGLAVVSQSMSPMDKARLVGLLQIDAIRASNGEAGVDDL